MSIILLTICALKFFNVSILLIIWFVHVISKGDVHNILNRLKLLAVGPTAHVTRHSIFVINGNWFCTRDNEKGTQGSGVYIEVETVCISSSKDNTPITRKITYYGVIKDIYLIDFYLFKVPLFKCDQENSQNDVKVQDGLTLTNLHQNLSLFENDRFILASQVKKVFYSREYDTFNWYVALIALPRGLHDMDTFDESVYTTYKTTDVSKLYGTDDEGDEYVRTDCEATLLKPN